jgi:hypothetical protein
MILVRLLLSFSKAAKRQVANQSKVIWKPYFEENIPYHAPKLC